MIKIAALTSGENVPSARFRVRQHIEPLRSIGIHVCEYIPAIDKFAPTPQSFLFPDSCLNVVKAAWKCVKVSTRVPGIIGSWKAKITWLERELHPGILTFEPLLKHPCVFDVDDAIWLTRPFGRTAAMRIAKNADVVLAGNNHIAEWFSPYAKDVRIVPTAVDTDRIRPKNLQNLRPSHSRFVIGWTGTSSNYTALYQIEKALEEFLKNHEAELLVVADRPPRFSELKPDRVRYVRWHPDTEIEVLGLMDVGLMPLPSDSWSLGKCSFKMLQYMAAGLPVVVSPVGMNVEVLSMGDIGFPAVTQDDWFEALSSLYHDPSLAHRYGAMGRLIVEKHFSRSLVSTILAGIFQELS